MVTFDAEENPLLAHGALPRFDLFEPGFVVPTIRHLLGDLDTELTRFEAQLDDPSWVGLIEPLEKMGERIAYAWGMVAHLMGVQNSDALREAYSEVQGEVIAFGLRQAQSRPLFDALEAFRAQPAFEALEATQKRIVDGLIRDAKHAGVGLGDVERERFNAIQAELAELGTNFSNHVLDATQAYSLILRDRAEIAGLPASALELAAQAEREAATRDSQEAGDSSGEGDSTADPNASAQSGPWRFSLDAPSFLPFLEHGERRDLREKLYRAYVTRASSGEYDNAPLIARILELRQEMSELLGFPCYADLSIDSKMAPSIDSVEALLDRLLEASIDSARTDLETLREFAAARGQDEPLELWDVAFYAERLREDRFDYSEEALRPYFPLPRVLDGLFALAERLFGVRIVAADGETPVWHPDVRFFRVESEQGAPMASFFLDPYSRPGEKRGGAWMDECLGRTRRGRHAEPGADDASVDRRPVAYLVCNQAPPVGSKPSLMSFDEVLTLFHEFGHGLQHMLTQVDYGLASGIRNIEWDAVELPSQFMENWCYHRRTLLELSGHFETGESLPGELFEKIDAARTYRAGSQMLRQLYFSSIDLALHRGALENGPESVFEVQRRISQRTTVLPPLEEDRFLCSFAHIFAGGYAAGYYSYKWAEVLSADAFAAFEEAGLDDPDAVSRIGRRFRDTVLALGGGTPPMEVFRAFRGREPSPDALLRHAGLVAA